MHFRKPQIYLITYQSGRGYTIHKYIIYIINTQGVYMIELVQQLWETTMQELGFYDELVAEWDSVGEL